VIPDNTEDQEHRTMSENKSQDAKAMPPASSGSVSEPMAFAVTQPDSYVVVHSLHSAFAMRDMCGGGEIVPLYRKPQPTLTDAEREAVEQAAQWMVQLAKDRGEIHSAGYFVDDAATLRGLLERLG
jgi:hypothetical protein